MQTSLNSIWFVLMKAAAPLQDDAHTLEREQRRELEIRQKKFMQVVAEKLPLMWHIGCLYSVLSNKPAEGASFRVCSAGSLSKRHNTQAHNLNCSDGFLSGKPCQYLKLFFS